MAGEPLIDDAKPGSGTVAEKWRRCDKCRKVKPVDDYEADNLRCLACEKEPVRATATARSAPVTTRMATAVAEDGTTVVRTVASVRDLRGRGDAEVRSRRARVRALDRLAEVYAEEFSAMLAEERRAEGL